MKKIIHTLFISILFLGFSSLYAQKHHMKADLDNISIKFPDGWKAEKSEKKIEGFTLKLYSEENPNHITIKCIKRVTNKETAVIDAAAEKSTKTGFEYMIIEKVKNTKLKNFDAKFLEYTNSPLRDYYRGGFYSLIDNGYTYIIDYYSDDTPEGRDMIKKSLNSLVIMKPDARPNFFQIERQFDPKEIIIETDKEAKAKEKEAKKELEAEKKSKKTKETKVKEGKAPKEKKSKKVKEEKTKKEKEKKVKEKKDKTEKKSKESKVKEEKESKPKKEKKTKNK